MPRGRSVLSISRDVGAAGVRETRSQAAVYLNGANTRKFKSPQKYCKHRREIIQIPLIVLYICDICIFISKEYNTKQHFAVYHFKFVINYGSFFHDGASNVLVQKRD